MNNSKILLTILLLAALALSGFLALESYSIWSNNHQTRDLLNKANETTEADVLAQSIKTQQNSSSLELAALDQFVLSEAKAVPLIEKIEEAGKGLKLATNVVSVNKIDDNKAKATDPKIIQITLETLGTWDNTMSFVRALESLPHRVVVDETTLRKDDEGWHARIILSLYSFD